MPFRYYGGKKSLSRKYAPPVYDTIIEPFAGSAGYALRYATLATRVILIEKNENVYRLWKRLQADDALEDLMSIPMPIKGERTSEPLIKAAGNQSNPRAYNDTSHNIVTDRMVSDWPSARNTLIKNLPLIKEWEIIHGDYTESPDLEATWFVDPPYWVPPDRRGTRGDCYACGAADIDFDALASWCRDRRGQTIVCEQDGATWLPFRPFALANTTQAKIGGDMRLEVVWESEPSTLFQTL